LARREGGKNNDEGENEIENERKDELKHICCGIVIKQI
jgi:hypothetical protein